ncbi:MAG TPA: YggS family pyridoxal phosphate-dependent enzyme [Gemmataceae bacterium]|nr:YggS family pyridoxal phosphate-dependent enzyme [Gemmataceae bacterium]
MPSDSRTLLAQRLHDVRERIAAACRRAGRSPHEVTLVAVTKTVDSKIAQLLPELGIFDLGESRPQELWKKAAELPNTVRWHLVGHLQRNKIERTLPLAKWIHSVDSARLVEALEQECRKHQVHARVLLEVNASHEEAKQGFEPRQVPEIAKILSKYPHIEISGLMTMAALSDDPELARPTFAELRHLRHQLRELLGQPNALPELSMGMTNDFEVAIEEGATLVRIGSALFEGLPEAP